MKSYNIFYFERFTFDFESGEAVFYYHFDNELFFEERISFFDISFPIRKDIDRKIVENMLFHIHIALGISYYKFFPTEKLIVKSGILDEYQLKFWKKFYLNGLGEFFYRNNINPISLLQFKNESEYRYEKKDFFMSEKYLVPIGGGKDSIVSLELLKRIGKKIDGVTFAVHDNILYENTTQNADIKRLYIGRKLSPNISEIIAQGYYNGHVPITGIIAFILEMTCYLYDYKYIVLSNELSANFGNTLWHGVQINHQWSKSVEFEKDFGEYVKKYISSQIQYFSLLRPFYELKIANFFAQYAKKYFSSFSSCNTNFKIFKSSSFPSEGLGGKNYWCNNCPKCAFVYAILRPYLTHSETLTIFGKELYEDASLETLFRELAGISGIKPFECVGTNEEVILAMKMAYESWEGKIPFILEIFKNEIHSKMSSDEFIAIEKKLFCSDFKHSFIPEFLQRELKSFLHE